MLSFVQKYGCNVYSQFNEDGVLDEIIRRINPDKFIAVEFGAPNWTYCSNTAYLAEKGWTVRMYDINPNDLKVEKKEITPENVNQIVGNPTVLSIDTDGPDYHIWKAYTGNSSIVIIEINSSIPPMVDEIPGNRGASYKSMVELGKSKGYFLIAHTGNLIWMLNKYKHLFPEITGDPIEDYSLYFNTSHL